MKPPDPPIPHKLDELRELGGVQDIEVAPDHIGDLRHCQPILLDCLCQCTLPREKFKERVDARNCKPTAAINAAKLLALSLINLTRTKVMMTMMMMPCM